MPLHDQTTQQMTLAGEAKAGEYFRPSTTLHIFEGDDLVIDRAYTYAPAIYPDTPLDAPIALASASKSITAAAVVQLMDRLQLPLSTPFAGLAGINNVPEMAMAPSVLDVLRNLEGFESTADSYIDHSRIDQSAYGEYPITGEMMFDYVVHDKTLGGHLDVGNDDNYWSWGTYDRAQQTGELVYSNPGYSMLGELLRVRTGLSYEGYVRTQLLEPLNLHTRRQELPMADLFGHDLWSTTRPGALPDGSRIEHIVDTILENSGNHSARATWVGVRRHEPVGQVAQYASDDVGQVHHREASSDDPSDHSGRLAPSDVARATCRWRPDPAANDARQKLLPRVSLCRPPSSAPSCRPGLRSRTARAICLSSRCPISTRHSAGSATPRRATPQVIERPGVGPPSAADGG